MEFNFGVLCRNLVHFEEIEKLLVTKWFALLRCLSVELTWLAQNVTDPGGLAEKGCLEKWSTKQKKIVQIIIIIIKKKTKSILTK